MQRNLISVAFMSLALLSAVGPCYAQTTNLPNPLVINSAPDGNSYAWHCFDSVECGAINLANAQAQGFFIPEGYSKTQPPAVIVRHGANVESQVMIGVGAATVATIAAWLIWGRDRPKNILASSSRVGLQFKTN